MWTTEGDLIIAAQLDCGFVRLHSDRYLTAMYLYSRMNEAFSSKVLKNSSDMDEFFFDFDFLFYWNQKTSGAETESVLS